MIVRESIDFKRTGNPKDSLAIGLKSKEGLEAALLKDFGHLTEASRFFKGWAGFNDSGIDMNDFEEVRQISFTIKEGVDKVDPQMFPDWFKDRGFEIIPYKFSTGNEADYNWLDRTLYVRIKK